MAVVSDRLAYICRQIQLNRRNFIRSLLANFARETQPRQRPRLPCAQWQLRFRAGWKRKDVRLTQFVIKRCGAQIIFY